MRRTLIEIVVEVSAARKSLCQRKQSDIKVHQSRVNNLLKLQLFLMKNNSRQTGRVSRPDFAKAKCDNQKLKPTPK